MYNGLHIPDNKGVNTQIFYTNGIAYQTWRKPPGTKMVHILCIGGGGGGGAGFTRIAGATGGGGGGGGSSAISRMTLDGYFCPDMLHLIVGPGGAPGVAGSLSTVLMPMTHAWSVSGNILIASGAAAAGVGGNGTAVAGGAAGAASTIAVSPTYGGLGSWNGIAGQAGTIGSVGSVAVGAVAWGTLFVSGGAGGGGVNGGTTVAAAGGNITAPSSGIFQTIAGGANTGGNGSSGMNIIGKYPISSGGSGGGGTNGVAGIGGNGGFGSGGGGGGAGTTGGAGGRGGDGIIIITAIS
jgi:hypothetical protein